MDQGKTWTIEAYTNERGQCPARAFIEQLSGRDRAEALALVKLLEELGNAMRRPHSAALGDGLFELRGRQVRLFYTFVSGRTAVLLDGVIKKRDDVPAKVLRRVRGHQSAVLRRDSSEKGGKKNR